MGEVAVAPRFGVTSMVTRLRRVAMRRPGPALFDADPVRWHYAGPLDPDRITRQYDAFAALVDGSGVDIEWLPATADGLADAVFAHDPSFVTGEGAVLLRPGKALRRPEVELHRALYDGIGVPVIGAIEPPGVAEGGDCVWLDEHTLAVGRGFRTNQSGIEQLRTFLEPGGVTIEAFDLPVWEGESACLHLMSLVSPLDRDLALVHRPLLPVAFYGRLRDLGVECLEAPEGEFASSRGLSLNVLALGPRDCVAIDGAPETARLMRQAGCEVATFPGDALCIPCEGGPTCLTRPIWRG